MYVRYDDHSSFIIDAFEKINHEIRTERRVERVLRVGGVSFLYERSECKSVLGDVVRLEAIDDTIQRNCTA